MFHRIHQKLGTAGFVISIVALIAALGGTALAAGGLSKSQEKQVTKIAKKYAGKPGATGATGPAGAAGKEGARGATGSPGTNGANGAPGTNGTNGLTGFTKNLPKGSTETGDWAIVSQPTGTGVTEGSAGTAISFNIPLAAAPAAVYVKAPTEEQETKKEFPVPPAGCSGNYEEPGAEPGNLCVFARAEHNTDGATHICAAKAPLISCLFGEAGLQGTADPSGAFIGVLDKEAGLVALNGTWAVTAE